MKYQPLYWRITPLFRAIVEIVIDRQEGVMESELSELLKKEYSLEFTKADLYHELMKLELQGIIQVEQIGKELFIKLTPNYSQSLRGPSP